MMKINRYAVIRLIFSALLSASCVAYADNSQHNHASVSAMSATHADGQQMDGVFLVKKHLDGYDVSFQVMVAKPGMMMGGSHDFMIKVEKDGRLVSGVVMNTKVIHPDGRSETKQAMPMGDWMMAGYDLGHSGQHQMMVLFSTPDGVKHKGGIYYPDS